MPFVLLKTERESERYRHVNRPSLKVQPTLINTEYIYYMHFF